MSVLKRMTNRFGSHFHSKDSASTSAQTPAADTPNPNIPTAPSKNVQDKYSTMYNPQDPHVYQPAGLGIPVRVPQAPSSYGGHNSHGGYGLNPSINAYGGYGSSNGTYGNNGDRNGVYGQSYTQNVGYPYGAYNDYNNGYASAVPSHLHSPTASSSTSGASFFDRRGSLATSRTSISYGRSKRDSDSRLMPLEMRMTDMRIDENGPMRSQMGNYTQSLTHQSSAADTHLYSSRRMSSRQFGSTSSQQFGSSAALDHIAHLSLTQQREKPGYRLADFWIQRTLGTGSFGRVHLVQSKHNLRFYAMKVLNKEKVVRMSQVEHTRNEARLLGLVESDFIIKLWGSFQDTQHLFMIMDFVAGGELFSLLRRSAGGVFPAHTCKFYSAEVYLALEYLHSHGIIYRDLKPENILLNHDGHIKLADFGFAKKCDTTFTMCGTPDYIAPELIAKTRYNKSVDWYALGVLIYEMLAGMPPYHDPRDHHQNPVVLYEKIRMGPDYIRWSSYIDPIARNLIRQLMESDPSKRLGNMQGGAQDIMQHYFYYDVNWEDLRRKRTQPPYMPSIHGEGDASAFERYPEDATYGMVTDDLYGDSFPEFNFGF